MNKLVYRSYKESDILKDLSEFEINNDFGCNNYVARSNSLFRSFSFNKGEQVSIEGSPTKVGSKIKMIYLCVPK